MIHHITLTGRSIALACDGTVTTQHGAGGATGAVYVEASHLTLLHDMRDGEFYRTGQNSWSPSGWRRLSEAPMRIANEQRRRTADDAPRDDPPAGDPAVDLALTGAGVVEETALAPRGGVLGALGLRLLAPLSGLLTAPRDPAQGMPTGAGHLGQLVADGAAGSAPTRAFCHALLVSVDCHGGDWVPRRRGG